MVGAPCFSVQQKTEPSQNSQRNVIFDLFSAIENGDLAKVQRLIKDGADVNVRTQRGWTPLHRAVVSNKLEIVKVLVQANADVNAQAHDGRTPLHMCLLAASGNLDLITYLVESGADPTVQDQYGMLPLHRAVVASDHNIVEYFVSSGIGKATINARDQNGRTPLHLAAIANYPGMVKLLIENKADSTIQDQNGMTPFDLAASLNHYEVIRYFIRNGPTKIKPTKSGMPHQTRYCLMSLQERLKDGEFFADITLDPYELMECILDIAIAREAIAPGAFDEDMKLLFDTLKTCEEIQDKNMAFENLTSIFCSLKFTLPSSGKEFADLVRKSALKCKHRDPLTQWQRQVLGKGSTSQGARKVNA